MIELTSEVLAALASARRNRLPDAVHTLWTAHARTLGTATLSQVAEAISRTREDAERMGLDTPERWLLWIVTQQSMPDMNGRQYLLSLDEVFRDGPVSVRIETLVKLSR